MLGFFLGPIGLLYAGRPRRAIVFFVSIIGMIEIPFFVGLGSIKPPTILQWVLALICVQQSWYCAVRYDSTSRRAWYTRWYAYLGVLCSILIVVFAVRSFLFDELRISSTSMLPGLGPGDAVVVKKLGYGNYGAYGVSLLHSPIEAEIKRGDLFVIEVPDRSSRPYLQRVIGLPGDRVEYADKKLSINGIDIVDEKLPDYFQKEPVRYYFHFREHIGESSFEIIQTDDMPTISDMMLQFPLAERCTRDTRRFTCSIPEGHYFLMGDHRDNSRDSRYFGFVPASNIVGKVVYQIKGAAWNAGK